MTKFPFSAFFAQKHHTLEQFLDPKKPVWEALFSLDLFLQSLKKKEHLSPISPQVHLVHPELVHVGMNVEIDPFVLIEGPCFIDDGAVIRQGAYIRKGSVIGKGVVVGHCSEIKGSWLMDGSKAPHFNYVGDSLVGLGVNLGCGATVANFRLDGKEIAIKNQGQKIWTGRSKLGAVIGDYCSIGCNAVLNPGTLLYPSSKVLPLSCVSGIVGATE